MNFLYEEIRIAVHAVWQRRWLALAVAWAICLLGWLVVALMPNRYESRARVSIEMQSILPDKIGMMQGDRQKDIDRIRQTLASTVNLEKVVRGTDLALQATSDRDIADQVEKLRKTITVKAGQDNIFEITGQSSAGGLSDARNAKLAKAIVQKLIDIFVEENLAGDRDETSQTLRFLDDELAKREQGLQDAEQKRVEFEQKYMGLLPGVGSIAQRMEAARAELSGVESSLISAQSSLSALNGQMAGTPATVETPNIVINNGAPSGVRGRIAALEGELSDAAAKGWTDRHPDVVAARSQLARLRSLPASASAGAGSANTTNPLYVTLRSMQAEKQATVAAMAGRKAQLEADMAQLTAKQADEPGVAAEQSRLNRDYEVLKAQYDKLLADREDVKLRSDVSSKTDAVKFRVIDPPSNPRVPVAPNRPLLLALVLIVGIGGGIGAAFAKGQLQTTYATAGQLAKASGLPVLGSISQVLTDAQKADRRQKLVWFAGGAGGLAGCFALLLLVELIQRGLVA
jgi:polysaccharide chain length determinant protein (PEP-CTERM system associated)